MFDLSTFPVSGGLLIGGALYAVASLGAGQVVGARTIDKMAWVEDCESWIESSFQSEIDTLEEEESLVPEVDCDSVIGKWHPAATRFCADLKELGLPDFSELGGYDAKAAREAEARARDLERRQLEAAAAGAGSQCSCAAAVYRREHMIGLAVYAGSARLVTLPHIENMESGLQAALSEPICANFTGGL